MELETFEIGTDLDDIGGDEIDLSQISVTDTLIGKTAAELTAALGEPSLNDFEKYHQGDSGISDINIGTFDSALIQDSGIKPYISGDEINSDVEDLANEMEKKISGDDKSVDEIISDAMSKVFVNADKEAKIALNLISDADFDAEDDFIGENGELLTDDEDNDLIFVPMTDDESDDWSLEEIESLRKDYANNKIPLWD